VKAEVAGVKAEVAGVKAEVADVKAEVEGVKAEVAGVKAEVHSLGVLVEQHTSDIRRVADGVQVANDRLERFQAEVIEEFANLRREMHWGFDSVHKRMDRFEGDLDQVKAARGA
jgi:archaellum component FlaC